MEYRVAASLRGNKIGAAIDELSEEVDDYLNQGFKPQGGVCVVTIRDEVLFTQAMIKHDE